MDFGHLRILWIKLEVVQWIVKYFDLKNIDQNHSG